MARRVGRPYKITRPMVFSLPELKIFAKALRKVNEPELLAKIRKEIAERNRSSRAYFKLKEKMFGDGN